MPPPADVIAIVRRALAKDRAARYADAEAMAAAIAVASRTLPAPGA